MITVSCSMCIFVNTEVLNQVATGVNVIKFTITFGHRGNLRCPSWWIQQHQEYCRQVVLPNYPILNTQK